LQLYRFLEEDTARFALTTDAGGARLPARGSVWLFVGREEPGRPDRPRGDPTEVATAILHKGYYLWPEDAGGEPRTFRR
jgi:hypothetical protein